MAAARAHTHGKQSRVYHGQRALGRLSDVALSSVGPDGRILVHADLAQVAATALSRDGREWSEVAGRKFSA